MQLSLNWSSAFLNEAQNSSYLANPQKNLLPIYLPIHYVDLIVWIDWSSLGRLIEWKFDKSANQYFDQLMAKTMKSLNAPVSLIPEKTVAICWQLL